MKIHVPAISLLIIAMTGSTTLAVGPGKFLEFKNNPRDVVIFDGTTHKNAGLSCTDCHNQELFPKMKQGAVKITMNDLLAGKYCGKCHDGKSAFSITDCIRCHYVPGA